MCNVKKVPNGLLSGDTDWRGELMLALDRLARRSFQRRPGPLISMHPKRASVTNVS